MIDIILNSNIYFSDFKKILIMIKLFGARKRKQIDNKHDLWHVLGLKPSVYIELHK